MKLSGFPGKIPETRKIVFNFLSIAYIPTKTTDQSCSNSLSCKYLQPTFFIFNLPLKLRVVYTRNKQINWVTTWNITNMINIVSVFKSEGETAKKVLLSVIWNRLLIEKNLSWIRTLNIKRKKVLRCARTFY